MKILQFLQLVLLVFLVEMIVRFLAPSWFLSSSPWKSTLETFPVLAMAIILATALFRFRYLSVSLLQNHEPLCDKGFLNIEKDFTPSLEKKMVSTHHLKGAKSNVYVRQSSLFSFEQWLEIEPSERRVRFFSALDLSSYAAKLRSSTPQGAKPISREAILRAFLVAPLEGISTFTQLHRRLESDLRFRYQCGFSLHEPVPSVSTLSRVFQAIVDKGVEATLFADLVRRCRGKRQFNPTWRSPSRCLKMSSSSHGRVLVCESTCLTRSAVNFGVSASPPSTTAVCPLPSSAPNTA